VDSGLARFGDQSDAIAELRRQVSDVTLSVADRVAAAWGLVGVDASHKDIALRYFDEVFADDGAAMSDRCAAARYLVKLDRTHWPATVRWLRNMDASLLTNPEQRADIVRTLGQLAAMEPGELARCELDIIRDSRASASCRRNTADLLELTEAREWVSPATFAELRRELLGDHMAWPSERVTSRSGVDAMLRDVVGHAEFDCATKLDAFNELAKLGPEYKVEVVGILKVASESSPRALLAWGKLGGRYRMEAIAVGRRSRSSWQVACVLDALGDEPDIDLFRNVLAEPTIRGVKAAGMLARHGHPWRAQAIERLRRMVDDDNINDFVRQEAAVALAHWSRLDRPKAVAVLDELAAVSWRAARALADLAPEYRDKVVNHLRHLMSTTPSARIEASRVIVQVDRRNLERAARVLRDVAGVPIYARRALFALGELTRPYSDEAIVGLRELMRQPDFTVRWRAAEAMAILRRDLREEASIVAREVARDATAPWHVRQHAAAELAKWSALCREEAREILRSGELTTSTMP
jgi:hypothetical protein